jgi:cysteine desulfurase
MNELYFDNAASTPVDPRVLKTLLYSSQTYFANPSNIKHEYGRAARNAMEAARQSIGKSLELDPRGIIFTSGATEANNLALQGTTCLQNRKCSALISSIEHACVDECARLLLKRGVNIKFIPTLPNGVINLKELKKDAEQIKNVKFISVMLVNNETGVIQPVKEISKIAKKIGAVFHTDAVQGIGKLPVEVLKYADIVSISGHKINGPKGIGCLWVKPNVKIKPILVGGGQESGIRSGTCPAPLIVAFAKAVEISVNEKDWLNRIAKPMRVMEKSIIEAIPGAVINGLEAPRVASISNISFPFKRPVIDLLKGLAVSSGAACGCVKVKPSKVLLSMGLDELLAGNSIRISAGRFNTPEEVMKAGCQLVSIIRLAEMHGLLDE